MREDKTKTAEGAALWRRAREGWSPVKETEAPEALWLAAYLDDRLAEDEPALLDELLALRQSLETEADVLEPVPAGVVARAQALRPGSQERRAPAAQAARSGGFLDGLFGAWLRPAVSTLAAVALLVACAGAFELGRYQGEQLGTTQSAEIGDSDVPVDLLLEDVI